MAFIAPLIRGRDILCFCSTCETDSTDETLHVGVITMILRSLSSLMTFIAASDVGPDLDRTIRYLAPFDAIYLGIDCPMPPNPPATR